MYEMSDCTLILCCVGLTSSDSLRILGCAGVADCSLILYCAGVTSFDSLYILGCAGETGG
jgi:hypothetical protein